MSANSRKSMALSVVLILLGITALFIGEKSLVLLIPAAVLIWYGALPTLRSGRN